jgi:hypothetical protein
MIGRCISLRSGKGYRCGWFHQQGSRLVMQPPSAVALSARVWVRTPPEAEVVGRVVGIVTRLNEPSNILPRESPIARGCSNRKGP